MTNPTATTYTAEELETLMEYVEMGIGLTNTIVNGVDDQYTQSAYRAIRAALVAEIANICNQEWHYMGSFCGPRPQYQGIKEDMIGDDKMLVSENAAYRLIRIEAAKLEGEKIDQANGWIKAAVNAYRRLTGAVIFANRVADWEADRYC
jgi:hypothetical protein